MCLFSRLFQLYTTAKLPAHNRWEKTRMGGIVSRIAYGFTFVPPRLSDLEKAQKAWDELRKRHGDSLVNYVPARQGDTTPVEILHLRAAHVELVEQQQRTSNGDTPSKSDPKGGADTAGAGSTERSTATAADLRVRARTPRAIIIMSHGNASDLTYSAHHAYRLWAAFGGAYSVIAYEYDNYAVPAAVSENATARRRTPARPSKEGVMRAAEATMEFVDSIYGVNAQSDDELIAVDTADASGSQTQQRTLKSTMRDGFVVDIPVVMFGTSLGSAPATRMAVKYSTPGLLLMSPFTSILDTRSFVGWIAGWFMYDFFLNKRYISEYAGQLLIFHGTKDPVVPAWCGRALYDHAQESCGRDFVPVVGAAHTDVIAVLGEMTFLKWLAVFFRRVAAGCAV